MGGQSFTCSRGKTQNGTRKSGVSCFIQHANLTERPVMLVYEQIGSYRNRAYADHRKS